jgi:hypothetical protein
MINNTIINKYPYYETKTNKNTFTSKAWVDIFNEHIVNYIDSPIEFFKLIQLDKTFFQNLKCSKINYKPNIIKLFTKGLIENRNIKKIVLDDINDVIKYDFNKLSLVSQTLEYLELNFNNSFNNDSLNINPQIFEQMTQLRHVSISGLINLFVIRNLILYTPNLNTIIFKNSDFDNSNNNLGLLNFKQNIKKIIFHNCSAIYEKNIVDIFKRNDIELEFKECTFIRDEFSSLLPSIREEINKRIFKIQNEITQKYPQLIELINNNIDDIFIKNISNNIKNQITSRVFNTIQYNFSDEYIGFI